MSKVFLIDVPEEYGVRGLIGDGKMLKFHFNGTCLGEFPVPFDNVTLQEVDIVSLLVSNNDVEIAVNASREFKKKISKISLSEVAKQVQSLNGLVFLGIKKDNAHGVPYTQYIYAFLKGAIHPSILG